MAKKSKAQAAKKKAASSAVPNAPNGSTTPADARSISPETSPNGSAQPSSPSKQQPSSSIASQVPVPPSQADGANGAPSQPASSAEAEDPVKRAEKVKEQGNTAFKAARYNDAIDLYTKAIELNPLEPSYLTNRAASYMAVKRFRPALDDCTVAANLQSSAPSSKTLLRLARCQLALGSPDAVSSTLQTVLELEPGNATALQLRAKVQTLEGHLKNFGAAKDKKDWGMARLSLDKCLQAIEAEGGEIPTDWRIWRVEMELSRKNLDTANSAANDALRLSPNSPEVLTLRGLVLFLTGKLAQALQHASSALRLDPGHEPALRLRKRVKDVERLKEEGNTMFKMGKYDDAITKYSETLDRIGEEEEEAGGGQIRATLLSNRATTLLKQNKYDLALEDTDASLLLLPTSFKALRTRARIHLHQEKFDQAIGDFNSAIQQASTEGQANDSDVKALKSELKKAEAALKRSKTKDYYKILGLERDCSETDIKKGYRRESLKHHPDKGGDEEKFKLVSEAHAVLSDPRRRERYDMGEDEDGMTDSSGMGGMGGMSQMDLAELFAQFHGGGGGFGGGGFGGGGFGGGGGGFGGGGGGGGRRGGHSHGFPF
ncbi:TPR-like protein [Pluteus cervinus]|uniref:TPR-like protein n=1 Tax=Pluteus cervinus TaxID=181527 RepID=A0ACD3BAC6_9AGAR|nr:TPR-like protein [Pluteus cervinus]